MSLKRSESDPCKKTLWNLKKTRKGSSPMSLPQEEFPFTAEDVAPILSFMVEQLLNEKSSEKEIHNFLAAFSNFGVVREELFSVLAQRFEALPEQEEVPSPGGSARTNSVQELPSYATVSPQKLKKNDSFFAPIPLDNSSSPPRSPMMFPGVVKTEGEALQLILRVWLFQSGALYKRQHPVFFRTVASFLSEVRDPKMNGLKLQLIKNKSESELDSALPFYQAINQAKQAPTVCDGFESAFKHCLFDQFSVQELAEGITFLMFRVYNNIGPSELHDGSWQGNERMIRAPHIHALSVLFNRVSVLCVWEILGAESQEKRVENFMKCVELAKTLQKMNNFEGMSAVASVFSNASISRLKPLWASIDSKTFKRVKKIEGFFKPQKNYKPYAELLARATAPALPWLAPKLRELRFMYDGNSKTTEKGYLSYHFLQMVGKSVNNYLEWKKTPYVVPVPKCDLVHILETVTNYCPDYVEDCFYDRSQALYSA